MFDLISFDSYVQQNIYGFCAFLKLVPAEHSNQQWLCLAGINFDNIEEQLFAIMGN
jgi:hypothetical protein